MIKRIMLFVALTVLFLEILLRVFLKVPSPGAYVYSEKADVIFNRPGFTDVIATERFLDIKRFLRTQNPSLYPSYMDVSYDSSGFRQGETRHAESNEKGLLLLGDSISFGWPLQFKDSPLQKLESLSPIPVRACSLLAAGPAQILKFLDHYCQYSAGWKKAVIQLTISDYFTFPDSLFIDSLGSSFHPKLAYVLHKKGAPQFTIPEWFSPSPAGIKDIQDFSDEFYIEDPWWRKTYLGRIYYYVNFVLPPEKVGTMTALTGVATSQIPLADRHLASLHAIEEIQKKLNIPIAVYLHPTRMRAHNPMAPRPDVEKLKSELQARGFKVYDQMSDPQFKNMIPQYYYANDMHPNVQGYQFVAGKFAELLDINLLLRSRSGSK